MSRHTHKSGNGLVRCEWYPRTDSFENRCPSTARYTLGWDSPQGFAQPAKRYCREHLMDELDDRIRQARHPSEGNVRVRFAPGLINEYRSLESFTAQ